jgi:hypothetical protein
MRRSFILWPVIAAVAGVAGGAVTGSPRAIGRTAPRAIGRTASAASAARLAIRVAPNPATAGDSVRIFGQLTGRSSRGTRVVVWHRLAGWRSFHPLARTTLDAAGRYAIVRRAGAVQSNQDWYAVAGRLRSPTLTEHVYAAVRLHASETAAAPGDRVTLSGHVTPSHPGRRILLRQQFGSRWVTIAERRLNRKSDFSATHTFRSDRIAPLRAPARPWSRSRSTRSTRSSTS